MNQYDTNAGWMSIYAIFNYFFLNFGIDNNIITIDLDLLVLMSRFQIYFFFIKTYFLLKCITSFIKN